MVLAAPIFKHIRVVGALNFVTASPFVCLLSHLSVILVNMYLQFW